ncbi:MAG: chondroitinase family polysaccharide lyase [Breznakibacter sp.]
MKFGFLLALSLFFVLSLKGQAWLPLENSVPSGWSSASGTLSVSSDHYKQGKQAIRWDWKTGDVLTINNPAGMAQACATYKGGMMLWVYNPVPLSVPLRFDFLDAAGTIQYTFQYQLNFKGWRACWIRFKEDMDGLKQNTALQRLKINAPAGVAAGSLWFDRMKFPATRIHDNVTPDAQLPDINSAMNTNLWCSLWYKYTNYQYQQPAPKTISAEEQQDILALRANILTDASGSAPTASELTSAINTIKSWNIVRNNGIVTGAPFVAADEKETGDISFKEVDKLIYTFAREWHHKKTAGIDGYLLDLLDHLFDQGLEVGSGLGTNHHYGYDFRNFPKALYLIRGLLRDNGRLQQASAVLQYWCNVAESRQTATNENYISLLDNWNTIASGRLIAILMVDDELAILHDLKSYVAWLNSTLVPTPGTTGGIKADGSAFHHGMQFVGYANGGYGGLGVVLKYFNGTGFQLSGEAKSHLAKGLEAHRNYAGFRSFPNSISGRNPLTEEMGTDAINTFAYLAKTYQPVDRELASKFMQLTRYQNSIYNEFKSQGITAAQPTPGNFTMNYAAMNIHRRDNWSVTIKGFNNIVTGTEIYTSNNRFGRYQSYGAIQIMNGGNPITAAASGFVEEGWDWNRFPGTTTIHLPYDLLNYAGGNINERSQTQKFAGSCSLDGQGAWGMVLQENDRENYTPSFKAFKSVFCFDNRLICLGSGIQNSNNSYFTETTLFQFGHGTQVTPISINNQEVSQFPYSRSFNEAQVVLNDPQNNGYIVRNGSVAVVRANQESRDNQTQAITYGDFSSACIQHGKAPANGGYEYVVLVNSGRAGAWAFGQSMSNDPVAPYSVIQKDDRAHVVYDRDTKTTGYVFFQDNQTYQLPHIKGTSHACIVMVSEKTDGSWRMAVANPCLNMEVPTSLEHDAPALPQTMTVKLKGRRRLLNAVPGVMVLNGSDLETTLSVEVNHGIPVVFDLVTDVANSVVSTGEDFNFRVYPSPTKGNVIVETDERLIQLSVFNMEGHLVRREDGGVRVIDLSPFPSGQYFIFAETAKGLHRSQKVLRL